MSMKWKTYGGPAQSPNDLPIADPRCDIEEELMYTNHIFAPLRQDHHPLFYITYCTRTTLGYSLESKTQKTQAELWLRIVRR